MRGPTHTEVVAECIDVLVTWKIGKSHLPDKLLRMAAPIVHGWWPSDTCGSICDPYIEHHSASEPAARRQIWMSVDNLEVPLR
ncbi:hypothetical protein PC128_g12130 [Phytophthora cactorum]|nr:hypothetical protein PC128_g12130 [Phytophthora cactorum]